MANNVNTNPIQVDTAGTLKGSLVPVSIKGIKIVPSGATWTVSLSDTAGNIVYYETNQLPGAEIKVPINCIGLKAVTMTSITRCLIYLAP